LDLRDLIYDWNNPEEKTFREISFEIADETLRDGLQSPSVKNPSLEEKLKMLHFMHELQIPVADIGLPGAGPKHFEHTLRLAKEIAQAKLNIRPYCAARTVLADIAPVVEISQKIGLEIEVAAFLGSSPIRLYTEAWSLEVLLQHTKEAVSFAVKYNLPVMYVTEDTTRSRPETLKALYTMAVECGARRVCISDTVGHATPNGVKRLVAFVKEIVKQTGEDVKMDWHGHRDRDLAIANTLAALEAGVDRVHGAVLGIGERVGNTPLDLLLVNLKLLGVLKQDLRKLPDYVQFVSKACGVAIPQNYPVFGADAFRTSTGVHASAIIKAEKKGDSALADAVYSGIPAGMFGLKQKIEIGPMSGQSNVVYWLEKHNLPQEPSVIEAVLKKAKASEKILTEEEILEVVKQNIPSGNAL
jgi:2-isopropylmalate synthase